MDKTLKVSIITPTYNHEHFISECIESVIEQTYTNWEHIIIDDGSSDNTWNIVTHYASRDNRIKAIRLAHKGIWALGQIYNQGLAVATGQVIAILEGDDWWPLNKLSIQVEAHRRHRNVVFSGGKVILSEGSTTMVKPKPPLGEVTSCQSYLQYLLTASAHFQPVSIVIERRALNKIGGFIQPNYFPSVDYPTLLALSQLEGSILCIDEVLGFYRLHPQQITHSMGPELIEGRLRLSLQTYRGLNDVVQNHLGISEASIIESHKRLLSDAYLGRIRHDLIYSNSDDLAVMLPKLWNVGNLKRKLQVIYAYMAAKNGWTMEPILGIVSFLKEKVTSGGNN